MTGVGFVLATVVDVHIELVDALVTINRPSRGEMSLTRLAIAIARPQIMATGASETK
jgi:hypothetical protein